MLAPAGLTLLVSSRLAAGAPCQGKEALCLGDLVTNIAVRLLRVAQLLQQPGVDLCLPPQSAACPSKTAGSPGQQAQAGLHPGNTWHACWLPSAELPDLGRACLTRRPQALMCSCTTDRCTNAIRARMRLSMWRARALPAVPACKEPSWCRSFTRVQASFNAKLVLLRLLRSLARSTALRHSRSSDFSSSELLADL